MGNQSDTEQNSREYINKTNMSLLKALTKAEVIQYRNPNLSDLPSLDDIIYYAQMRGEQEIIFDPPMTIHKDVTKVFSSSPYNFAVTETNLANDLVRLTKIDWR